MGEKGIKKKRQWKTKGAKRKAAQCCAKAPTCFDVSVPLNSMLRSFRWYTDRSRSRSAPPAAEPRVPEPTAGEARVVHPDPHYADAPAPSTEYNRRCDVFLRLLPFFFAVAHLALS